MPTRLNKLLGAGDVTILNGQYGAQLCSTVPEGRERPGEHLIVKFVASGSLNVEQRKDRHRFKGEPVLIDPCACSDSQIYRRQLSAVERTNRRNVHKAREGLNNSVSARPFATFEIGESRDSFSRWEPNDYGPEIELNICGSPLSGRLPLTFSTACDAPSRDWTARTALSVVRYFSSDHGSVPWRSQTAV